ncbi:MAG: PEP-CTERM sorting domain-containing protein, partial [Phycisphaerae bacterium]
YEISGDASLEASNVDVGGQGGGLFRQLGGNVLARFGVLVSSSSAGATAEYQMHQGHLDAKQLQVAHYPGEPAHFVQHGGTVDVRGYSSHIDMGLYLGYSSGTVGTYSLDAGTLAVERDALIGRYGEGLFTQTGGSSSYGRLFVGAYAQTYEVDYATGHYEHSGGTCHVLGGMVVGLGGAVGTYNLTGGQNVVDYGLVLGNSSHATGTYTVSGGSLTVGTILWVAGRGTGQLEVIGAGGSVQAGEYLQTAAGTLVSAPDPNGLSTIEIASTASLGGTWLVRDDRARIGRFDVLTAAGGLTGDFDDVLLPGPNWTWGIDGGRLWVEHVPEPATLALLALGGLTLMHRRKR